MSTRAKRDNTKRPTVGPRDVKWNQGCDHIAGLLNNLFDHLKADTEGFTELVKSKMDDTDRVIVKLVVGRLRAFKSEDEFRQRIEEAAAMCMRYLWMTCFSEGMGEYTFDMVMDMLRDTPTQQAHEELAAIKRHCHLDKRGFWGKLDQWCCILNCSNAKMYHMNSLPYCQRHRGYALIVGMRHQCLTCQNFTVLALKTTDADQEHQKHNALTMLVPLRLRPDGQWSNVQIRRWCSPEFTPGRDDPYYYRDERRDGELSYWAEGVEHKVPNDTWIYCPPNNSKGGKWVVTAWLQAKVQDHRQGHRWRPVTEAWEMEHILTVSDFADISAGRMPLKYPCPRSPSPPGRRRGQR